MCISCGCGKPNDDHGDARNITVTTSNGQGQQSGNTQFQSHQGDSNQSQAQQNKDAQAQNQPGTYQPSPGHQSGTAWGQDQEQINYQPPEEQKHTS